MRIRISNGPHRRLMCLFVLSLWSFILMVYLWKQLVDDELDSGTKTSSSKISVGAKLMNLQIGVKIKEQLERLRRGKRIRQSLENKLDKIDEPIADLNLYHRTTLKIRSTKKTNIDYGRDRDVDVEGVNDYLMWHENFQKKQTLPFFPRQRSCKIPATNIAFVKTHYTGSNVITNILNRYGDLNNLNMALPSDGRSTFYWPKRFQWKYIDITLLNGSLPNIVANHARYNNDIMDNILYPGSVYITILRDPASQLETTFNNLNFGSLLEIWNTTSPLKAFIDNPKFYIQRVIKRKRFKDTLNLIKNGQFFDLGLSTTDYHRNNVIHQAIQELYDKFTLVLIYEHLDESLILMKRKFCWQLDDIVYLKFHYTNENTWNDHEMSEDLKNKVRKWNQADMKLYRFFNDTLWTQIGYEGKDFWKDFTEFKQLQLNIEKECLSKNKHESKKSKMTKRFLKAFQGDQLFGSGEDEIERPTTTPALPYLLLKLLGKKKQDKTLGRLLHDVESHETELEDEYIDSSSGSSQTDTNEHVIVNKGVSSWNEHFCGKLLSDEDQYLDYFRRRHAYTKSFIKHHQTDLKNTTITNSTTTN
ncbi:galactose-3-O-sulfotransferase 2-like [Clytia hemisphaerica]|uniref:Galactosylceramide sulfotransferase-like n=1 Tax=Clytia hemisphaerica TaxID=252671 RepID=A0A7M5WJ74_9CNID